ncbi:MAG: AAA family ATPase [Caldithrix sp.]|nr:AAA family ATPase [Caldithrix sp.]
MTKDLFDRNLQHERPLAERCRPDSLDAIVGHSRLIGEGSALRKQIDQGYLPSVIFWGPPGVGKTTLARLLAKAMAYHFIDISAVSSGVREVKNIISDANDKLRYHSQKTLLFIDEIHRFNKAQQDALLHAVEEGTLTLVGATTENPSFEVIAPLLSRCQVLKMEALTKEDLQQIIQHAIDYDALLKRYTFKLPGMDTLIYYGSGDARRTLNLIEIAFHMADKTGQSITITEELVKQAADQNPLYYDKKGDAHYDTISAFIKSVRGSDPDGAIYWLAKMIESGEDPVFIARRLIILASEDIGNAEPYALMLANNAFQAVTHVGMPEARIILAQVTTYLASVPKSNAAYLAINRAQAFIRQDGLRPVPLHLRNAPTDLMKLLNYGADYKYPHDFPDHFVEQSYWPKDIKPQTFYEPTDQGREFKLSKYLQSTSRLKKEK